MQCPPSPPSALPTLPTSVRLPTLAGAVHRGVAGVAAAALPTDLRCRRQAAHRPRPGEWSQRAGQGGHPAWLGRCQAFGHSTCRIAQQCNWHHQRLNVARPPLLLTPPRSAHPGAGGAARLLGRLPDHHPCLAPLRRCTRQVRPAMVFPSLLAALSTFCLVSWCKLDYPLKFWLAK